MFALFPQIALQKCYALTTVTACSPYSGFKLFWMLPATCDMKATLQPWVLLFIAIGLVSSELFLFLCYFLCFFLMASVSILFFMNWPERSTVFQLHDFRVYWGSSSFVISYCSFLWMLAPLMTVALLREAFTELALGLLQAFIEC